MPPPPIGFNLFNVNNYLTDSWVDKPRASHTVNTISRGPKGTVRAVAVAVDSADADNRIGAAREDESSIAAEGLRKDGTKKDTRLRVGSVPRIEDLI
jgi:hypothetical protein